MATGRPNGRPAKPVERHRDAGTGRNLPNAPMPNEGLSGTDGSKLPSLPESLGSHGTELWAHVWTAGKSWLAIESDRTIVTLLCNAFDEHEEIREKLATGEYERVYVHANGSPVTTPWVTQLKELRTQMTTWLSQIGFSPSDRSRLGLAEVRVRDQLDELTQKRVGKSA
jgi:P27 family predicted phage terminase small subunit